MELTNPVMIQNAYGAPGGRLEIFYTTGAIASGGFLGAGFRTVNNGEGYSPMAMRVDDSLKLQFNTSTTTVLTGTNYELREKAIERISGCTTRPTILEAAITAVTPTYGDPTSTDEVLAP
jgi:hypothetical protein